MINRPIGKGENAKPAPLPEAHFRTTNEMLDDFAFLGKDLAYEIVVTNTQAMADQIEEVEVVKKDLYTPFIDRAEEQVAEMTYARAFELYGNPLPDIIDLRIEKELSSILGNGFAVIYLASQMLVNRSNERGYLVGSRGSVGSSFVATMIGITESIRCRHIIYVLIVNTQSSLQMDLMDLASICLIRNVQNVERNIKKMVRIFLSRPS